MRDERENCCDDIAVEAIRSKEQYIHALVAFQEYNLAYHKTPALAFAGSRQRLLYRVKRLLINENKKLNHMEKMILVCSMVVLTAAFSISSGTLQAQNKPLRESQRRESVDERNNRKPDPEIIDEESRFEHLSTINSENNGRRTITITATDQYGKKYVLRKSDGRITRLIIDNREVDENDFPEYKEIIEKIELSNAKNRISKRNNNNNNNDDDVERDMQLSREAELLAKQRRTLETDLARQHRDLELRNRRNDLENEDRDVLEERAALKRRKQQDIVIYDEEREQMKAVELHKKLSQERIKQEQREMQLHQKLAEERIRDEHDLLEKHKRIARERIHHDQKIAHEHQQRLMEEQREAQFRNRAQRDQLNKALILENQRQQNINRNRKVDIDNELNDEDHERIAEQRERLIERKMELREKAMERQKEQEIHKVKPRSKLYSIDGKAYLLNKPKYSLNKQNNNEINGILEVLQEEGVIDDTESVSFSLNDDELIVNGRRQSESLHESLKDRYIHNRADSFIYEKNGNSTKTTINRNR
jgi:hypothetical protein